jgi:hypothetical protein
MARKIVLSFIPVFFLFGGFLRPAQTVRALPPLADNAQPANVTAFDLILAMNTLRVSFGLPP